MFDHQRLDVYGIAPDFVIAADDIVEQLPKGRGYLVDQLRRASTSIAFNIAEGAGEFSSVEKARFYRLARRSATESAAILDVCSRLGLIAEEHHSAASDLLHSIVSMLTRLAKNKGG
jgi:four helix bundle protein